MSKRRIAYAEYRTWAAIIQRTTNPNAPKYPSYGGRGITVCDSWREFSNFYADMGDRPTGHSIERVDNSSGYSADNCIWATRKRQQNNMRANHNIAYCGVTMTLSEWGEFLVVKPNTILTRIRPGWEMGRALGYED